MRQPFVITIWLDTRRQKKHNSFPVKLRVYSSILNKTRLYPTRIDLNEPEFLEVWTEYIPSKRKPSTMTKYELDKLRLKITSLLSAANEIASKITPFNFERFEKNLYRDSKSSGDLIYYYTEAISEYKSSEQFGTAEGYDLSLKSLKEYLKHSTGKVPNVIPMNTIDEDWLHGYENFMTKTRGKSLNTVGAYLRYMRALFNKAIKQGEFSQEYYPFDKSKYTIPKKNTIRGHLDMDQLTDLYNAKPKNPEQEKAKDFFFFSYCCNGMNTKDILLLQWKQVRGNKLTFVRSKTKRTTRNNQREIEVLLEDTSLDILERRASKHRNPNDYVFDIIPPQLTAEKLDKFFDSFNKALNVNLKSLASTVGIDHISMMYARHSFATNQARSGATFDLVRDNLGHSNGRIPATFNYIGAPDEKSKRELIRKMTSFKKKH